MKPSTAAIILALAWAMLFFAVPARAEATTEALAYLCGHEAVELAGAVRGASRRYLVHGVVLVAMMAHEVPGCRMDKIGAHHERCAMQLHGAARNGRSNDDLAKAEVCIDTGARWLTLMDQDCRGAGLACALGAYNTGKVGKGKGYARRVIRLVKGFWRAMASRSEVVGIGAADQR